MKTIWIVNQYGPIEGENWRDYSYNQIGKYLSEKCGYKVIWWTSNFAHHFKTYRSNGWKDIYVNEKYIIRLVPTTSYKKNIGIGRFVRDISYSINAKKRFRTEDVPDLIISSMLPMTYGEPTYNYAIKNKIPYIVNTMDIWPEFIEKNLGRIGRVAHYLFWPNYIRRKHFYANASGLMALSKNYLEFAKKEAGEVHDKPTALVYNGIDVAKFNEAKSLPIPSKALNALKEFDGITCIFAGTLGPSYDVDVMLKCAEECNNKGYNVRFVIAGSGPRTKDIQLKADELSNLFYLGSLKPTELVPVYCKCDIGLCAYSSKSNVDMPDKFYDYCAAGLAVVNSLKDEVAEYVKEYEVGYNYIAENYESMLECLQLLYNNRDLLNQMRNHALSLGKNFDSNVQNGKLRVMIEGILSR